jgi:hypothetical protein
MEARDATTINLAREMLEALHDFKEVLTFKLTGGWSRE